MWWIPLVSEGAGGGYQRDLWNDPEWSADRCVKWLRVGVVLTMLSLGFGLVMAPMFAVSVAPLPPSERPPGFYTYALDWQCAPNVTVSPAWLTGKLDYAPTVHGCGGWGDHVSPMDGHSDGRGWGSGSRQLGMVFATLCFVGVLYGCVLPCLDANCNQCDCSQRCRTLGIWTMLGWWSGVTFAFLLGGWFVVYAAEFGGRQDTWICRPYAATFDFRGALAILRVMTDGNRRASLDFTDAANWAVLQAYASECKGITVYEGGHYLFDVRMKASPDVAAYLDSVRERVMSAALQIWMWGCVACILLLPPGLVWTHWIRPCYQSCYQKCCSAPLAVRALVLRTDPNGLSLTTPDGSPVILAPGEPHVIALSVAPSPPPPPFVSLPSQ
jgi:hypothetical protein